jgi:hypothetical protein
VNLLRIGETTVNMDRVDAVLDNQPAEHPGSPEGERVLRILFDNEAIELGGAEAQVFRRWLRQHARNLAVIQDGDGEPMVSPEEQLLQISRALVEMLDSACYVEGARNKDLTSTVRKTAHRLNSAVEGYITGQLAAKPVRSFEKLFE